MIFIIENQTYSLEAVLRTPKLSQLSTVECTFITLQDGIQPMWEDPRNRSGGRWVINLDKKRRAIELDHFWLEMVSYIALISLSEVVDDLLHCSIDITVHAVHPVMDQPGLVWEQCMNWTDSVKQIHGHQITYRTRAFVLICDGDTHACILTLQ